jgi:acyl-coenzyme A synthetase/AMP-(fatty) acid ligase
MAAGHVVMLLPPGTFDKHTAVYDTFKPSAVYRKIRGEWQLKFLANGTSALHEELTLLLSTSGSTGSPKLVKLTKANIQEATLNQSLPL